MNLFSEKNISKLIIFTPVLSVILGAMFTIYFFIQTQYDYFEQESFRLEEQYLQKQKDILKREIDYIIEYIDFHVKKNKKLTKKELQEQLKRYIETIRYEKNGYLWIHDTSYHLVAHPFRAKSIGTYDIDLKDAMGTLITKKFIDETVKSPKGVFIDYYWQKPKKVHFSQKIGFFRLYEKYNWVIGAGLYIEDIESSILKSKKLLEKRMKDYIRLVILASILVIITIGILSFFISKRINKVINEYKENLQDLNKNLEDKIQKALKDAKRKDRALLHQSRLARMGAMLSMIAHQWRQPLSEISGILMELETANKFKKLDDRLLNESVQESNKLIQFMSHTIDDFRNFFKPDKKKVHFYIDDACNEAISLARASIKSYHITLNKKVNCNSIVYGYEREFAQVMLNLISNAKDVLNQRKIEKPQIDITIDYIDKEAIICVEDNAGGVKEEHLELIFEPYFTTKSSSKGTGLGLYISKMIIETNMNGELSVENTNKGALFKVQIGEKDG